MRNELIVVWMLAWTCSVVSGEEVATLSRQENLLAAAKHLKAAGFDEKAAEVRRLAKIDELELRAKKLVATLGSSREHLATRSGINVENVLGNALASIQAVQQKLDRMLVRSPIATVNAAWKHRASENKEETLMLMLTPRGPIIQEEEEERILGELP